MEGGGALLELFKVHRAIEQRLGSLQQAVNDREDYTHILKRVEGLRRIVTAHCEAEDEKLLPVLRSRMGGNAGWKRRRDCSPVAIELGDHSEEFSVITPLFDDICEVVRVGASGGEVRQRLRGRVRDLITVVGGHLKEEEETMKGIFQRCLGRNDQGSLLVDTLTPEVILWTLSALDTEDKVQFLATWVQSADDDRSKSLSEKAELDMGSAEWTKLWKRVEERLRKTRHAEERLTPEEHNHGEVPQKRSLTDGSDPQGKANGMLNPLIELKLIHAAIRSELSEIRTDVRDLEPTDDLEVRTLQTRVHFLQQVHDTHSEGEDVILLAELSKMQIDTGSFDRDHACSTSHFEAVAKRIASLLSIPKGDPFQRNDAKIRLGNAIDLAAKHLVDHMAEEETHLLPLVESTFSVEEQGKLVRRIRGRFPPKFLEKLIPWMLKTLALAEQRTLIQNIYKTSSTTEFAEVVSAVQRLVSNGMFDSSRWDALVNSLPELKDVLLSAAVRTPEGAGEAAEDLVIESASSASSPDVGSPSSAKRIKLSTRGFISEESGPVGEVLRVHKAIRVELREIVESAKRLLLNERDLHVKAIAVLAERVTFLRRMVEEHSRVEDTVLLPKLEERVPGIAQRYEDDHCKENELFARLSSKLERLQCASDKEDCVKLVRSVRMSAQALQNEMMKHLDMEEGQLWPVLISEFSVEDQEQVVGRIFGQMPASVFREMLPWMVRVLSTEERDKMLENVLMVTRSTMFEQWLESWFPVPSVYLENSHRHESSASCSAAHEKESEEDKSAAAAAARVLFLKGRKSRMVTIKEIARDTSLPEKTRSMLIQKLMLAPWEAATMAKSKAQVHTEKSMEPEYTVAKEDGRKVFGCKHYRRNCKVVAKCCGKYYMCRLCHDAAESHTMNRTVTEKMFCLFCKRTGPIGKQCTFKDCGKTMAKYFCGICKFFDDDDTKKKYHCLFCNVCRAGKGLGFDFFHCMKCNACMSMKYEKDHKCLERAMESECPVCRHYLFTSTSPLKYLRCGHLMHLSCYSEFSKTRFSCPLCSTSLEDMSSAFKEIDYLAAASRMPAEYRHVRCELFCRDCRAPSNVGYHFLFNKCPKCGSYNTRVERVDANGR